MKRIKLFLASLILLTMVAAGVAPMAAFADSPKQAVCGALGSDANCKTNPSGSVSLNSVVSAGINTFSLIIGVVAVIMIMVSGLKYITAGGDSSKITSAKNTLIYAIVGLVVAALAEGIVKLVLTKIK